MLTPRQLLPLICLSLLGVALLLGACAEARRGDFDLGQSFEAKDFYARQERWSGGSAE